jgi:hypothetical protein
MPPILCGHKSSKCIQPLPLITHPTANAVTSSGQYRGDRCRLVLVSEHDWQASTAMPAYRNRRTPLSQPELYPGTSYLFRWTKECYKVLKLPLHQNSNSETVISILQLYEESPMEDPKVLFDGLTAFGTVAVAVLAIWGDRIKSVLAPPELAIQSHDLGGVLTEETKLTQVYYYYLKVVNLRPWFSVKECRVLLVGIERRLDDMQFHRVSFPVPQEFYWAPQSDGNRAVTITKERVFDFGKVVKRDGSRFEPTLTFLPPNFNGFVGKKEAVRYYLEVDAEGFASRQSTVVEVAWNGIWSDERETMAQNLIIHTV